MHHRSLSFSSVEPEALNSLLYLEGKYNKIEALDHLETQWCHRYLPSAHKYEDYKQKCLRRAVSSKAQSMEVKKIYIYIFFHTKIKSKLQNIYFR